MGTSLRRLGCLCFIFISFQLQAQQIAPRPLITRPIDETQLTPVRGSTHPLSRPQFDVGIAPPALLEGRAAAIAEHRNDEPVLDAVNAVFVAGEPGDCADRARGKQEAVAVARAQAREALVDVAAGGETRGVRAGW